MPKYVFECSICCDKKTTFTSASTREIPCSKCQGVMTRHLPNIGGQEVREMIDTLTGVSWKQDQKEILKKRRDDYYWEVEVPRLIQTHSVETSIEQGWLVYNEKGELVIGKPPAKR